MIPPESPLQHNVDRLMITRGRVFGWGWAAHRTLRVKSIQLRIEADGWTRRLPAAIGHSREDVEAAHPGLVDARTSGYLVTGFVPSSPNMSVHLEIELEDGARHELDVHHSVEDRRALGKLRTLSWIARAVWRRVSRGDFAGVVRRAKAQHYGAPSLDEAGALDRLTRTLARARDIVLVFDNNMGGGSNQYRRTLVAERVAAGQTVLLCTYNLPMLEYRLHLYSQARPEQVYRIATFLALEQVIAEAPVTELFVNSPVSFDDPLALADWLAVMRGKYPKVRLTVTAHDFFVICPSFVLLNAEGRFCGVPEPAECASCLERHTGSFVSLSPPSQIGPWRASWGRCLEAADEVRCFSEATRRLLARAYPSMQPPRVTVIPHRIDFVPGRAPVLDHRAPLVLGIVGEITFQKGALLVQEMVDRIDREGLDIRIVVIGTLDIAHKSPRLTVNGPYRREQLVELIEGYGINMVLFPSIWPETFSYVVAELMQLALPIVAFDIGAPAERLRSYRNARLCPRIDSAAALDAAIAFHRELALGSTEAA